MILSSSHEAEIPEAEEKAESNTLLRRLEEKSEERLPITFISSEFSWRAGGGLNKAAAWATVNVRAENAENNARFPCGHFFKDIALKMKILQISSNE